MKEIVAQLRQAEVGEIHENHSLAPYTTWKIGGPADLFITVADKEKLQTTLTILGEAGVPWFQLGRGSNLLVRDKGVRGAVIKLGRAFETMHIEGELVTAGGAYSIIRLAVMAAKRGLTGLEFSGGIPGTVGGAVYMNAGALGSDISRILQYAEVVLETGEVVRWTPEQFQFSYRHSRLQTQKGIVTEAVFRLEPGDQQEIDQVMMRNKEHRLQTQPIQLACAGSVFRNPTGGYAAQLIEASGLKGMKEGRAEVSSLHANFIINTGQATASDVLRLIDRIREQISERHGVELIPEVLVVGEV